MIYRSRHKNSGFTMVEILLVLSLIGVLSVAGVSLLTNSVDENRYDMTLAEMEQIRNALIGDTKQMQGGARSSFGYLGDVGAIPSTALGLAALTARPGSVSAWAVNSTARIGTGWNGPYLSTSINGQNPLTDSWGRNYVYTTGVNANITSLGADGIAGGSGFNQDIVVNLPQAVQTAVVYGFISNGGAPFNNAAQVEINYPNGSGSITSTLVSVAAGAQGAFQFSNIPLGVRSISIYVPSKATATQTLGPILATVDKNNYLIPVTLTDLNPSGGGGGGGGGGGLTCSTPSGIVTAGTGSSSGTSITIQVNVSANRTITSFASHIASAAAVASVQFPGRNYACAGARIYSPCPVNDNATATLAPTYALGAGSRTIVLNYGTNVTNETSIQFLFNYSTGGCDLITVSGLL